MSKIRLYREDFLEQMRQQGDPLADAAVQALYSSGEAALWRKLLGELQKNTDILPDGLPEAVYTFFELSGQLPSWADQRKMERGATFFARYGTDLMLMLGFLSLPYDYAAAKGAQVLYLSQRLYSNPGKRLMETGQYVTDITDRGAFLPKGKAVRSIQKVRLMHAAVRYHILQSPRWQEAWGYPINQEDMAGTNLSIALLPVRGLRKLGLRLSQEDTLAYLHLWNVASSMMGVDQRLLPDTAKEAYVLEKMIAGRQHAPSEAGQQLTRSLLRFIQQQTRADLGRLVPVYMRYLLGDRLADALKIPAYPLAEKILLSTTIGFNQFRNLATALLPGQSGFRRGGQYGGLRPSTSGILYPSRSLFALPQSLTS